MNLTLTLLWPLLGFPLLASLGGLVIGRLMVDVIIVVETLIRLGQ
jgi:hypothetical protein